MLGSYIYSTRKHIGLAVLLIVSAIGFANAQAPKPADLAQAQLEGYNQRDIEAFLKPYADSVKLYLFPNQLLYSGKAIMRQEYASMFKDAPDLHCTVVKRIVIGNKVIDEESVVFKKDKPPVHAVAIYTVEGDKITAVHFVPPSEK